MRLQAWGPVALSLLWAKAGQAPGALSLIPPRACGQLGEVAELRERWGRPQREGGRWAQRWSWGEGEALVTRDRWPGRWTVLEHTGLADGPCQELVGEPAAAAMLRLGPPDASGGHTMRWNLVDDAVVVVVGDDGLVASWSMVSWW